MAKPIEPTLPYEGEDAEELIEALNGIRVSETKYTRMVEESESRLANLMRPKGYKERHDS